MKEPRTDLATLVLALALAGLGRAGSLAAILLAYAAAWSLVNAARALGWPREPIALPRSVIALACVALVAVPLRDLAARASAMLEHEGIASPLEHVADRLAIEGDATIFPELVSADRPQTYFVRAIGARARVRLGDGVEWIDAEPLGHGVFRLDYDPRAQGAVSGHAATATIEIDGIAHTRAMLAVTPLPHPRWLRVSPDRTRACVTSEETDELLVIAIDRAPERIETLDGPHDCAIDDDGSLWVVHRYASAALHLDAARQHHTRRATGLATIRGVVPFEGEVTASASTRDGSVVYVATRSPAAITRLSAGGLRSRRLAMPAAFVALDASEARVGLSVSDFDEGGHAGLGNHFVQDRIAWLDATTLALEGDHLTAWRTERQDHAGDVDRGASPMGVFATTRGTVWVAFAGTDEIEEVGGPAPRVIDTAALGLSAPHSVVELADGSIVVTSPSSGRVAVLDRDGSLRASVDLAPTDRDLLRSDPSSLQLRYGERAFYEATRSGVSCQSCHLHGGTDGATHNIGGRLAAPTLDVRGLIGTSPYLRDGSYPRLRDLDEVARVEYRGYRLPAGDRGANVEAWLRTLPLPATRVMRDRALEREGLDVFFRAGCPDCHAPPAFTSLGLHAIEAVFPDAPGGARLLDVPSLRSVAVSAPYLFDGRAATLESVFVDQNDSDRHGHTRALDDHERSALFAFLRSL